MRLTRLLGPGLLVFALLLAVTGVLHPQTYAGLPSVPLGTLTLVPALRLFVFLSGAMALGGAALGVLGAGADVLRLAGRCALIYALASALLIVATLADVMAVQWWDALNSTMLKSFLTQIDEGRYLTSQVVIGLLAGVVLLRAAGSLDVMFSASALAISVVLPAFTGHSAVAVAHWLASATMVVHLLAMSLWVGGVLVLLLRPQVNAVLRFAALVNVAVPALLLSGAASVIVRVNDWASLPHDPYALVLALKLTLTAAVLWLGVRTRRAIARSLAATSTDVVAAVRRSITLAGALMVAVLGVAVVLARMPNP